MLSKKRFHDPATGDELSRGEYVSWHIQGLIRRWSVLVLILVATAACWLTGSQAVLLWWNLSASLLAIMIEFIVGLAMFGQTKRDATVLREVRAIGRRQEILLRHMEQLLVREAKEIEEMEEELRSGVIQNETAGQ